MNNYAALSKGGALKELYKLKLLTKSKEYLKLSKFNIIALDITKAFDTVSTTAIRKNLEEEILKLKSLLKAPEKLADKVLKLIHPLLENRDRLVPQGAPCSSLLYVIGAQKVYNKLAENSIK